MIFILFFKIIPTDNVEDQSNNINFYLWFQFACLRWFQIKLKLSRSGLQNERLKLFPTKRYFANKKFGESHEFRVSKQLFSLSCICWLKTFVIEHIIWFEILSKPSQTNFMYPHCTQIYLEIDGLFYSYNCSTIYSSKSIQKKLFYPLLPNHSNWSRWWSI